MERIKNLNLFQKIVLLLLVAMMVIFAAVYFVVTSRVGFAYRGSILVPETVGPDTVYTGKIYGEEASITVTADKIVTFTCGGETYGPYTAREDSTAVPQNHDLAQHMTGVEIREGEEVVFRGGVLETGGRNSDLMIFNQLGEWQGFSLHITTGSGGERISYSLSAETILKLMKGPELTHKGEWVAWFYGVLLSLLTAALVLFADELFHFHLSFQIRNADRAEPSDWEMAGRYISWVCLPIMILVLYIMGLQ